MLLGLLDVSEVRGQVAISGAMSTRQRHCITSVGFDLTVRRELSTIDGRHYPLHTKLLNSEMSSPLRFEDPNSFFRTFLDWTGHTPGRLRNEAVP